MHGKRVACIVPQPSQTGALTVALMLSPEYHDTHIRYRPNVLTCSRNANRGVTFTFDDGPGRYTAQLLDVLKALDVKATFFVCGNAALRQPEVIRRMVEEGHEVGSHTTSHKNLTQLMVWNMDCAYSSLCTPNKMGAQYGNNQSTADPLMALQEAGNTALLDQEVIGNEDIIFNLTGKRPKYLRPPYGAVNADVLRYLGARGYDGVVMWSGGCIDWFFHDYMKELPVYINGMADAGALLCFHDNNDAGEFSRSEGTPQHLA